MEIVGDASSLQRGFRESARGAKTFERDMTHATRGVIAGSGAIRSLGRSLAFASGGFIAFAGVSSAIRKSIEAASDAAVTQKQLAAQFKTTGVNLGDYQRQIDRTSASLSALSGFTAEELTRAFVGAYRGTRNVTEALKIEAVAADVARGRHIDLQVAQIALQKAASGSATALRRLGIILPANVKGMDAVTEAGRRFAGQAQAGTTAQQRLNAILHNSEVIIGTALLPTVVRLADHLGVYLTKLNETGKLQRDVNETVRVTGAVVHGLELALSPLVDGFRLLAKVTGGSENAAYALAAAFGALKLRSLAANLGLASGAVTTFGRSAAVTALETDAAAAASANWSRATGGGLLFTAASATKATPAIVGATTASRGLRLGLLGVAAAALIGGDELSKLIRQIPHWDSLMQNFGSHLEDLLSKQRGARILGIAGAPDAAPSADASKAVGQAVRMIQRGLSAQRIEATLKTRFHLDDKDIQVFLADARRRISQGLGSGLIHPSDVLGRVVGSGRVAGVFPGADLTAAKRKALSLQARFNLLDLQLAKAALTTSQADDRAILAQQAAIVKQQAEAQKNLAKRTQLYQQLGQIDAQIASIDAAGAAKHQAAVEKRAAARKAALEKLAATRQAAQERLLGLLELGVERAGLTKGLGDDLKALDAQATALKRLLVSDKGNLDLQRQLVGVEQARASVQAQQRDAVKAQRQAAAAALEARQFAVLGLGPTGQDLVPTMKALRAQLAKAVGGIALDQVDAETRKQLAEIQKLLSGRLGKLAEDVRARIAEMLAGMQDKLKKTAATAPAQLFADFPTGPRFSVALGSLGGTLPAGGGLTYAPTIVSPDLEGAAKAQKADWFRFRQQFQR